MSAPDSPSVRLDFALTLADAADVITTRWFRRRARTERKADGSLVTLADREAEATLRARIRRAFPDDGILGEEEGEAGGDGRGRWIVDPIDGTHNFARGVPVFATLVAFERGGTIEAGVASAPALGTRWFAARGGGAWRADLPYRGRSGDRIRVSAIDTLVEAQILFGEWRHTVRRWRAADAIVGEAWRDRGFGDFWGHCLVAEGAAEAMLDPSVKPWDVAALVPIVEEAGGRITDDRGGPVLDAGHAVAANAALAGEILRRLADA